MIVNWASMSLIVQNGPLNQAFIEKNVHTFANAVDWVHQRPYGRGPNRADWRSVLALGRGTCSTKHALVAALAKECLVPVSLMMGIYMMDEHNTPGIESALVPGGFDAIPEAHCYLKYQGQRIDITMPGVPKVPVEMLVEQVIEPDQIGEDKLLFHKAFVQQWASTHTLDVDEVWRVREQCIAALSV